MLTIGFGVSAFITTGHQYDRIHSADTSFSNSAYSIFKTIRQAEDSLPSGTPNQIGKIFLQDSSTLVIASSGKNLTNNTESKNFNDKNQYLLSVKLSNPDYILTGSLTVDNKNWCFNIKENHREAFYNQNGFVIDNINTDKNYLGHSSCLDGVAYNVDGQAILGSINPK